MHEIVLRIKFLEKSRKSSYSIIQILHVFLQKCMKQLSESKLLPDTEGYDGWILVHTRESKSENLPILEPFYESDSILSAKPTSSAEDIFGGSASRSGLGKSKKGMFYR